MRIGQVHRNALKKRWLMSADRYLRINLGRLLQFTARHAVEEKFAGHVTVILDARVRK